MTKKEIEREAKKKRRRSSSAQLFSTTSSIKACILFLSAADSQGAFPLFFSPAPQFHRLN